MKIKELESYTFETAPDIQKIDTFDDEKQDT